ncbi:MAG: glycosyl transferase [Clostridia bacterium]|nr:glycosyl transferase [Clostridia bacterium]
MYFNSEKARDTVKQPAELIRSLFTEKTVGIVDAEYTDAARKYAVGACGIGMHAPVCRGLLNNPALSGFFANHACDSVFFCFDSDNLEVYSARDGLITVDDAVRTAAVKSKNDVIKACGYIDENGGHVIDLKLAPVGTHFYVNLLIGDRYGYATPLFTTPKSAVDAFGRGSFRAGGAKQVLSTAFSVHLEDNGDPANRQFYIVENGKKIFYSLDAFHNVRSAVCRHLQNYTRITYETECGLIIDRLIFIMPQHDGMPDAVEVQRITVKNVSGKKRNLKIVATGVFGICSPESAINDIMYSNLILESEILSDGERPIAVTHHAQPDYMKKEKRFAMLLCNGEGMDEYCVNKTDFIGNGSLADPQMLVHMTNNGGRKAIPFFAMGKYFTLDDGQSTDIDEYVGIVQARADAAESLDKAVRLICDKYGDGDALTSEFDGVIRSFADYSSYIRVKTGNNDLDTYLTENLPFQVMYQTFVSRAFAWTQKGYRETGFREIQDIYGSMYYLVSAGRGDLVRELISMWARNVYKMGYANHDFTWSGKDAGKCSDDQLWLAQAVYRYVMLTDDYDFLNAEFDTADSGDGKIRRKLIDTLIEAVRYSGCISIGAHGLPLLDKADWNDTLKLDRQCLFGEQKQALYERQLAENGQKYGTAFDNKLCESVMNAFLLIIAADETAELADAIGRRSDAEFARSISDKVRKSVDVNCYFDNFYARALINDGREGGYTYLGADGDGLSADGRIGTYFLNSYSWSILAGVADEQKIGQMLDKVEKELKTPFGCKLCTPVNFRALGSDTATGLYFYGDRENGGVFKHAEMMAAVASLKAAKIVGDNALSARLCALAFFMINKVLPFTTLADPYVTKGNPRFCTQYINSDTGENIGPILSGTSSWLTLAVFEILGIQTNTKELHIDPIMPEGMTKIEYSVKLDGEYVDVTVSGAEYAHIGPSTVITVDGQRADSALIKRDGRHHTVEISL